MSNRFSTDVNSLAPVNMGAVYNSMIGQPTNGLQRRQARETADVLAAYASSISDPQVRQAVINAVQGGAFSSMNPQEAQRAVIQMTEQASAEAKNTQRDKSALALYAAEIGGLDPELVKQFGLDPSKPTGQRADELRAETLARLGRNQIGSEQQGIQDAEIAAARSGTAVNQKDLAAIRTRSARTFANQRGAELAQLRQEDEARRQQNIGRLGQQLSGTQYEGGDYAPAVDQSPAMTYRTGRITVNPSAFGVRFGRGGESSGGLNSAGSGYRRNPQYVKLPTFSAFGAI